MDPGFESQNLPFFEAATSRWLWENATQGIIVTDAELKISYCNRWIRKQTEVRCGDMIGKDLFAVFPEIEARGLGVFYHQALAGETRMLSHRLHKYLLELPANLPFPGIGQMQQSSRIAPLFHGGNTVGTITVIEDVTDRFVRERELSLQLEERERLLASELAARELAEETNRLKDEFLATVSHEIRAPLNAIRGWSLLLRRGPVDTATFNHAIDTIDRNVVAQSQIIDDLLDISRMVSGQLKLDFQTLDMADSVAFAVENISVAAAESKIELVKTIDADACFVTGDRDRIQQVLWNLISNAIKFTPPKGRIEIILKSDREFVNVTVKDNGAGITPEFVPYVFDRFRQADGSKRRRHGGLGLGLSIVRNLVELHGGTVDVESAGEGQGTSFTVTFPRIYVPQSNDMPETDDGSHDLVLPLRMLKCRILIVDDDTDSREMLSVLLSTQNAEVRSAGSVTEALAQFETFKPDLLVSDLGMPVMDGYDLIKQIRSLPPESGGSVPAIALTGYVSIDEQRRVRDSGFDSHMSKPLDHKLLIQKIGELLDNAQH